MNAGHAITHGFIIFNYEFIVWLAKEKINLAV